MIRLGEKNKNALYDVCQQKTKSPKNKTPATIALISRKKIFFEKEVITIIRIAIIYIPIIP